MVIDNGEGVEVASHVIGGLVNLQQVRASLMETAKDIDKHTQEKAADMGELRALKELRGEIDKKLKRRAV